MKLTPDGALSFRYKLEQITREVTEASTEELALASIAVSLKRIADALDRRNETQVLTGPGPNAA